MLLLPNAGPSSFFVIDAREDVVSNLDSVYVIFALPSITILPRQQNT
jgi:hypothetical protein